MSATDGEVDRFSVALRGPRVVYGEGVAAVELTAELDQLKAERVLVLGSKRELGRVSKVGV